jgi:chromosome segregation ATPase
MKTLGGVTMKITKTMIIFAVLALFILSIAPMALADESSDNSRITEKLKDNGKDIERELREKVKTISQDENLKDMRKEVREKVKTRLNELGEEDSVERIEKARARVREAKGSLEDAREHYIRAKEKYELAQELFHHQRGKLKDLNKQAKACREDSDECRGKRTELKKGVKNHLLKTNEVITRSLEKLMNRVESSTVLTEDQKAEAIANIELLEEDLISEKERVDALAENATNAELREAIKELKHTWQDVRKEQKRIVSLLISSKLANLSERLSHMAEKMQESIDRLSTAGADVSELEVILGEFNTNVAAMEEASGAEGVAALKTAKEDLRKFKTKEKELRKGLDIENEDATETEDESDDQTGNEEENADDSNEEDSDTDEDQNDTTGNLTT